VKALKYFRVYVLHSRVSAYVPSTSMKYILIQPNIDGRRGKWIAKILEFDLEIKPTKLVKGQGLAKLLAESNCKTLGVSFINACTKNQQAESSSKISQGGLSLVECTWYKDIFYFLQELKPPGGMGKIKARDLNLKAVRYFLTDQVLYWRDPLGVFLRFLSPQEAHKVMFHFHSDLCGGHHFWKTIAHKIIRARYYWPTLFTDVYREVRDCIKC
jgi:hypothetical protein